MSGALLISVALLALAPEAVAHDLHDTYEERETDGGRRRADDRPRPQTTREDTPTPEDGRTGEGSAGEDGSPALEDRTTREDGDDSAGGESSAAPDEAGDAGDAHDADDADDADGARDAGDADHARDADGARDAGDADHARDADHAHDADEADHADHANDADEADEAEGSSGGVGSYRSRTRLQRSEPTASATTVPRIVLEQAPRRTSDDLLRTLPGLQVAQHAAEGKGLQLMLRGFDAAHGTDVEIVVDDIPLNQGSHIHGHGYLDLAWLPAEAIQRVQLLRGSYDLEQGLFATAGTVQLRTGVPEESRGWTIASELGSTRRARLALVWAPEGRADDELIAAEVVNDPGFGRHRDVTRGSLYGQARVARTAHGHVAAGAGVSAATFGVPSFVRRQDVEAGRIDLYGGYDGVQRGQTLRSQATLTGEGRRPSGVHLAHATWLRGLGFDLTENTTGFLLDETRGDERRQVERRVELGHHSHWHLRLSRDVTLRGTHGYRAERIEHRDERTAAGLDSEERVNRDTSLWQHHVWTGVSARVFVGRALELEPALRLDTLGFQVREATLEDRRFSGGALALSPRFRAAVRVHEQVRLFGAWGRGVRPPEGRSVIRQTLGGDESSAGNERSPFGSAPAAMTTTDTVEVGLRWVTERSELAVAGFGTWMSNEVYYDHISALSFLLNPSRRLGAELIAGWWVHEAVRLQGDLSLVDARFVASGAPVPGAPPVVANVSAWAGRAEGFNGFVRARAIGARPLLYGAVAAPYATLDAGVGYRAGQLDVALQVENALGAGYREAEYNYASRWFADQAASQLPAIHYAAGLPRVVTLQLSVHL